MTVKWGRCDSQIGRKLFTDSRDSLTHARTSANVNRTATRSLLAGGYAVTCVTLPVYQPNQHAALGSFLGPAFCLSTTEKHGRKCRPNKYKQEAQLMLTNPREAFRGQSRSPKHGTIRYVKYGFLIMCYSNFVTTTRHFSGIRLQKCRYLGNWVRGPSGSLEMSPFDRAPMTSYWRSIVTIAVSRVISEIFNVEKYRDLEIPVKGHSRSLKVIPFDRVGVFLLVFITLSLRCTVFEIFDL